MVNQQEMETSLYFLNVCGLRSRENISTDLPIIAVVEGLVGNGQSGFRCMNGCIRLFRLKETMVVTQVDPSSVLGRLWTWDTGGFTKCTVKAQLLPGRVDMSINRES